MEAGEVIPLPGESLDKQFPAVWSKLVHDKRIDRSNEFEELWGKQSKHMHAISVFDSLFVFPEPL